MALGRPRPSTPEPLSSSLKLSPDLMMVSAFTPFWVNALMAGFDLLLLRGNLQLLDGLVASGKLILQ